MILLSSKNNRFKGILSLILLSFIFAVMGVFARYFNTDFLLLQQVYLRILMAFLLGLIIFRKNLDFSKLKKITKKEWLLLFFRAFSLYVLGVVLFTKAVIITKYSSFYFVSSIPITAILGILLLKEKINIPKVFYILLAFSGVIIISVKDYSNILSFGKGELFALISAVFMSLSNVTRKWHTKLLNNKEITQITFLIAFLILVFISLLKGDGIPTKNWSFLLLLILLVAGFLNVINIFLRNFSFEHVQAIIANNIIELRNVFAVLLSIFLYKEFPTAREFFGGLIIIISVIGINKIKDKNS